MHVHKKGNKYEEKKQELITIETARQQNIGSDPVFAVTLQTEAV